MSNEVNPYYILGKLMEKGVDYDKIKDFVEHYISIAKRNGEKPDDAIARIKNFSMELNDNIINASTRIQKNLPVENIGISTDKWLTVADAAECYGITAATIRNWIKDKDNPLPHEKFGKRKTRVLLKDLHEYAKKFGKKKQ